MLFFLLLSVVFGLTNREAATSDSGHSAADSSSFFVFFSSSSPPPFSSGYSLVKWKGQMKGGSVGFLTFYF